MKILYADDDEDSRIIVTATLEAGGHEVVAVADGALAWEKARSWLPDLIISDILMPHLDGFALRRSLAEDPRLRSIPFVFYSGTFVDEEDARLARDLGAARFMVKPMAPDELLRMVVEVQAEGPASGGAAAALTAEEFAKRTEERLSSKLYKKYREVREKQLQLEAREATLQGLVAAIPDVLFALDPETFALTYVSPVLEAALGYRPEELVGDAERWKAMVHPDDLDRVVATLVAAIRDAGGEPTWVEGRLMRRGDEAYRWFDVRIAVTRDDAGQPRHISGVLRDVTDIKAREEHEAAAQRMEALGELTGGVAHDFNNLLSIMLGNLQLAERHLRQDKSAADDQVSKRLRTTINAVMRGSELTRRLLAFARRQQLEPQVVDLNELVTDTWELLKRTMSVAITVNFRAQEGLWPLSVDPGQFGNALINLAANARDAMPGGGTLTIETANVTLDERFTRAHQYMQPGDYVVVMVSDTGTGMTEEQQARAFEPFFTTKESKGTGLGLSMVYGFVKQSGGSIIVYSEVGIGTTLKLYFPRVTGKAGRRTPARPDAKVTGGDERILVVEDDEALRETVVCYLRELGYGVVEAENGKAALSVLAEQADIDLLFTDVVMPGGMTGLELANRARSVMPDIKVLYTSGYSFEALSNSIEQTLHNDEIVNKPYMIASLARRVRGVLDG